MTSLSVAKQTFEWLRSTGRISGMAEQKVADMGKDSFLQEAANKWDAIGSPRFMQGMKDVMMKLIWSDN